MDIFTLTGEEGHPSYQRLEASNNARYYDFLYSLIDTKLSLGSIELTHAIIRSFNAHAIAGLYEAAGQYRTVQVFVGDYTPPPPEQVEELMDGCVSRINAFLEESKGFTAATYALWRINHIHPFVNGNGRTARAACYFPLCMHARGMFPGPVTVPERLARGEMRERCVAALQYADQGPRHDLMPLGELLAEALEQQVGSR